MKILKIASIVAGIHLFAFLLIFANPGCSSTTKPAPQPADTIPSADPGPMLTVPTAAPAGSTVSPIDVTLPPPASDPSGGTGSRFVPTRPNTPAASAVLAEPVENVTPATTYTVKNGDSLWSLQKRFHVSIKEIATANNLKMSVTLHDGQKLIIPSKSGATTTTAPKSTPVASSTPKADVESAPKTAATGETYTVKPGESLDSIARRFGVKPKDLAVHNNVDNPLRLRAGTVLSIPTSKGGASSRSSVGSTTKTAPREPEATKPPVFEPEQSQPVPTPTPSVPVIRLDEGTDLPAPAPKS